MQPFIYQNTTKIIFGAGQIAELSKNIPSDSKVLVLYGNGSIKTNGVYEQIKSALAEHQWDEFSGIAPNPQFDTLMCAVEKIKAKGHNYLLAVGGGSVIDSAKFIAAAVNYEGGNYWDILDKSAEVTSALPIGVILTLPATGSETNAASVISNGKDKLLFFSPLVRPKFAILDPQATLSLPMRYLANGVVDAFVHVIEQYITYPVNAKVQDRFAEGILSTLIEDGPKVLNGEQGIHARENIMLCATFALNDLIGSGVPQDWTTHMIGHELTALYGIDHARTLSIILPAVLKVRSKEKAEKLVQFGNRVLNIHSGTHNEKIHKAISGIVSFFKEMGVPTNLPDAGLSEKDIPRILQQLEKHGETALGEHADIDLAQSKIILETAISGST